MLEERGTTYVDCTIQIPGRVAVAILRFQLDSCEKKTAKERLNRGWTRIYADERQEPRMHTNEREENTLNRSPKFSEVK
jgi:hypothetical protein